MITSKLYFSQIIIVIFCFTFFGFSQEKDLDQRLIGKWVILFSKDATGKVLKDDFSGKGYIDTYTKNGAYMVDPNYLRDDMKRNGIKEPLDYSLIPTFSWKTIDGEILVIKSSQGTQNIRYNFSGDTLLMGFSNGNTKYLLKNKR